MRIAITTKSIDRKYAVKDGQIYYVWLSVPCAVSDLDDPFAKPDITPYLDKRSVQHGCFVEDANGYSARAKTLRKSALNNEQVSLAVYQIWCTEYNCNLTWEQATKLAGWC